MTKTRSQTLHLSIKREECEDRPKLEKLLHSTNNMSNNQNKATEKRTTLRGSKFTKEQIADLIGYIVNDNMTALAAGRIIGMDISTALKYYKEYTDDPEHKIPLPRPGHLNESSKITQKKIEDLIKYIVQGKENLTHAARRANMNRNTAVKYYARYLEDPERKIPILDSPFGNPVKRYTQEQVQELIGYIVNDNMSVLAASRKVKMPINTAKIYYLRYLEDPNHEIPVPGRYNPRGGRICESDKLKKIVDLIEKKGMNIREASVKADMAESTASKYYRQYLDDPNRRVPKPERSFQNIHTPEQIKSFFTYIIVDKLDVPQASRKANMLNRAGRYYYQTYLKNPIEEAEQNTNSYSVAKMKKLIGYIQNDMMSIKSAAVKANLQYGTARKNYSRYLNDPQHRIPTIKMKQYTYEDTKKLINYVEKGKMSVGSAATKINMSKSAAFRFYKKYKKDRRRKIPEPQPRGRITRVGSLNKYSKMIADIYKNNSLSKKTQKSHHPKLGLLDIKQEPLDDKKELKQLV